MKWSNVKLIFFRETRDQLRDRRMIFMIAVLPLVLYPLLGLNWLQLSQFMQDKPSKVLLVGVDSLPDEPALVEGDQLAEAFRNNPDAEKLEIKLRPAADAEKIDPETLVQDGLYDAVVVFPPDFADRLSEFQQRLSADDIEASKQKEKVPQPEVYFDTAKQGSGNARLRLHGVLGMWREDVVRATLRKTSVSEAVTKPFEVNVSDVAKDSSRRAAQWSRLLPFIVVIWALTGAFYPAVDLCAGEKERGTLETLLSSPADRSEIVWGKLLTVMTFSVITSILNLVSMGLTGLFVFARMADPAMAAFEAPPLAAFFWLVIGLLPVAAFFSALALAIAAFARSSKEGQYYLMPLLLITLPLMMLPMMTELELGTALLPITGLMLLMRALIEGQYMAALTYLPPVALVTGICCLLAIRWAVDQFHKESVMFRESERWGLGLWLKHVIRERRETPSISEAMLCATLLLVIRFFASFAAGSPSSWNGLATMMIVSQLALIATPALLMAMILTRDPLKSLHLKPLPKNWLTVPFAVLFAFAIHPVSVWLSMGIRAVYPISDQAIAQLAPISEQLATAPLVKVLLVMAFLPAICEELAFRGFILSGLRRSGKKWMAITVTALLFGVTHGILQQSISAALVGILIGYITVQSGSLIPAILFHFTHNSLAVVFSRLVAGFEDGATHFMSVPCKLLLDDASGETTYRWPVVAVGLLLSLAFLRWYRSQPYDRTREEQLHEELQKQQKLRDDEHIALKVC